MKEITLGKSITKELLVTEKELACNVGSGIVEVYATPMMIALMENAATSCLQEFLEDGETSVGIQLQTTHDAATPCGMKVRATATITAVDRKRVSFEIIAEDEKDRIGTATHVRCIVKKDSFESRAKGKLDN